MTQSNPVTCPKTWDETRLQKAIDYVPPIQYGCSDMAHGGMRITEGDAWDVLNDMMRHREVFVEAITRLTDELAAAQAKLEAIESITAPWSHTACLGFPLPKAASKDFLKIVEILHPKAPQ